MMKKESKEWQIYFSEMLKCLLKLKGMTQSELANKIGVTEVSISRYINMERIPKITTVIDISKALDVDISIFTNIIK